jgi:(1->4)-alpha-D-glucan 1-alpha-D-glucosylmutase
VTLLLTCPGIPDLYQGTEVWDLSLVDPDNRRPVDFDRRRDLLARLAAPTSFDECKLLVTARALRLRRDHPDWFAGDYTPLHAEGAAAAHAVAFARGGHAVTVVTRLPCRLRCGGGWEDTVLPLPEGHWHDVLTGADVDGRRPMLAALTARLPVALLVMNPEEPA